jgi:hypothetical protein
MVLLNPAGLAALALVPVLVALYLLRLKRKTLFISSILPWRQVIEQTRRRSLFHKLRSPLSLLLQLLILTLVAFALARPEFSDAARTVSTTVVLLDTSVRMQASDAGGIRFETARRGVESLLRRAHSGNQIALVAFDAAPRVLAAFSPDERALLDGLRQAAVNDCPPDLDRALRLARDLLASRDGARRIIAVTDLPIPESDVATSSIPIKRMDLGGGLENIAITSFSARPLLANPTECEALVEVQNFSRATWDGTVEFHLDGELVDARQLSLKPGESAREIVTGIDIDRTRLNPRGWLTAKIPDGDALASDNTAYAVAPSSRKRRVLVVSHGNWFLQNLFTADNRTEYEMLSPDNFRSDSVRGFDAVVFDSETPRGFDLATLPAANLLFIGVSPFSIPEKPARRGETPTPVALPDLDGVAVTDVNSEHPLLRGIEISDLTILKARALPPIPEDSGWQYERVANAGSDPIILAGRRTSDDGGEQQRCVVLAFGIAESDLPLRVAFPLFVNNTLQWLTRESAEYVSSVPPGQPLVLDPGESIWILPQRDPSNVPEEIAPQQIERVSFRPAQKGFYQRDVRGRQTWIAVSGASAQTSDLAQPPEISRPIASGTTNAKLTAGAAIQAPRSWSQLVTIWPPWILLACGALAALSLEWWLFHKRRTE